MGTGIGGAYVVDGKPLHGLHHPEMGTIRLPHDIRDPFPGSCPFHAGLLEGLASGPAIKQALACGARICRTHPFWELEAQYIGAALANYILVLSPASIVLGGGIMQRAFLLPRIREHILRRRSRTTFAGPP